MLRIISENFEKYVGNFKEFFRKILRNISEKFEKYFGTKNIFRIIRNLGDYCKRISYFTIFHKTSRIISQNIVNHLKKFPKLFQKISKIFS